MSIEKVGERIAAAREDFVHAEGNLAGSGATFREAEMLADQLVEVLGRIAGAHFRAQTQIEHGNRILAPALGGAPDATSDHLFAGMDAAQVRARNTSEILTDAQAAAERVVDALSAI